MTPWLSGECVVVAAVTYWDRWVAESCCEPLGRQWGWSRSAGAAAGSAASSASDDKHSSMSGWWSESIPTKTLQGAHRTSTT